MVNGKSSRQKRIPDDRQHYDKWEDMKRKAEKRVEWRMPSLQSETCPWAELYDLFIYLYSLSDVTGLIWKLSSLIWTVLWLVHETIFL